MGWFLSFFSFLSFFIYGLWDLFPFFLSGFPSFFSFQRTIEHSFRQIYRYSNCLNKHRRGTQLTMARAAEFVLSKGQQVQLLESAAILSFMESDPTSPRGLQRMADVFEGGKLPKAGEPDPEEGVDEGTDGYLPPPPPPPYVVGYGSVGGGGIRCSNNSSRVGGRMRSGLFGRLRLTHVRVDRGCTIMRFVRVSRGHRLCRSLCGYWVCGLL